MMFLFAQPLFARSFDHFLNEIKIQALAKGISEKTLNDTFPTIKYVKKSVQLDRKQSEFTVTFEKYQQNQLPNSRVKKAVSFLRKHKKTFDIIERTYQVPREQIVALWAIESNFGAHTGKFHIPSVLATLAYDGRRAEMFTDQLLKALQIIDQGHITSRAMIGSWAGAMGQSQFMPSSFLNYAVDFTQDGTADIWRAKADVWASIANYLQTEGWQYGKPTKIPAILPQNFKITENMEKNDRPLRSYYQMGVKAFYRGRDNPMVRVIAPDRSAKKQAFVTFNNFYVLLHWNRSYFFALTAADLAEKIRQQYYQ
ncbi:MAG: membrane-bound lytic murein transglycosylase B [Alphaproteobacteria bacterium]|jgi:membrane-bound lytic murein transglycosylase B